MPDLNNEANTAGFPLLETGKLSEFRFSEPFSTPSAAPINLSSASLATTFVLVDDINDRVWINAAVSWFTNFAAVGTADVTFTLLRDGVPILSVTQSVFNPLAAAATVFNVVSIQFVDQPLAGMNVPPLVPPVLTPVTYTLNASTTSTTSFTTGPITLSAAEIEPNSNI